MSGEKLALGANYMGRSFSVASKDRAGQTSLHDAGEFVVVEVGVYAGKAFAGALAASDFRLVVDGKTERMVTPPGVVANALRNREMDPQRRRLIVGGGMGNAGVVMGAPRVEPRFPGDPRPGQQRPVGSVQVQEGEEQRWDGAVESSLVEGVPGSARAGNLFFHYEGKMTKVKSMVLMYESVNGKLELKLR